MTGPGRVDLNALALRPGGSGVQTYIRELLGALPAVHPADYRAHVQSDAAGELPTAVAAMPHPVAAGARRALCGLSLPVAGADVHHGLDADLPLRRSRRGGALVATIHDLSVFDVPEAHGRVRAAGERRLVARAIRRADVVLAPSTFTAERVMARFGRSAHVTPLAPRRGLAPAAVDDVERVRRVHDLPEECVVQVGSIEPRKETDRLAEACRTLGVPLVLAGLVVPGSRVPAGAIHLGRVPDADLAALYGAATVVAYCSRYEGFGLPAVEALACGATLLTTDVGGIAAACADAAAIVPPGDTAALTRALGDLVRDPARRAELAARGPDRAARRTWRDTALDTVAAYRAVAA